MYNRKIEEKRNIKNNTNTTFQDSTTPLDLNKWHVIHCGGGTAGYSYEEVRGFYRYWTYNDSKVRKNCNAESRAKQKDLLTKALQNDDYDDLSINDYKEYKKLTKYSWTIF